MPQVQRNLDLFINVSVEAYPTLRANENFMRLQDELTETENRISVARRDYNEPSRRTTRTSGVSRRL
jgi:hypothetical protein